jgi:Na+-driven multidrug efflux pump
VGGKLGAGKLAEAKDDAKKIIVFGMMLAAVLGGIMFIVAPYIHHLYELNDAAIDALEKMVRIKSVLLPIYVINVCTFFILRAGGDTWSTLLFDSVFLWFGQVLISTGLSMFTSISLVALYITVELLDLLKMIFAFALLKKGKWVRNLAEN